MFVGKTRFSLVSAMTAMLALGLPLEHVVRDGRRATRRRCSACTTSSARCRSGAKPTSRVLDDDRGRWVLRDNEGTQVVADRMLRPRFCLRAGVRYDADASILPRRWRRERRTAPAVSRRPRPRRRPNAAQGVGASLRRKEDARFLRGRGQFVGDIRLRRHARRRFRALARRAWRARRHRQARRLRGSRLHAWPISTA